MFYRQLTLFLRSLYKNKAYGLLNITGLSIGITFAALIFLWVENECTYNHHFPKRNSIYRVMEHQTYEGKVSTFQAVPGPMAQAVKAEIPGIRNAARTTVPLDFRRLFSSEEKSINEQGLYADSSLFSMLDLPFVYGTVQGAFSQLHAVVISATMSKKFFGDANPVGKTLKVDNGEPYRVTGVFKDLPANSSFRFQWLIPFSNFVLENDFATWWNTNACATYIELEPAADVAAINQQLKHYLLTKAADMKCECFLTSMNDWHLGGSVKNGKQVEGPIRYVRLFTLIACIILLIACINFMNLATAQSEQRAKEIGIKKTLGASRGKLVAQLMGESLILSYASVGLAVLLLYLLLPVFNELVGEQLSLQLLTPRHGLSLLGIGLLTGVAAGSYPAFYLSSFKPLTVFKGVRLKTSLNQLLVRKGLVVIQFSVSIGLIICTTIVYQQIRFAMKRDLGYTKENVIYFELKDHAKTAAAALQNDLMATGMVDRTAFSAFPALHIQDNTSSIQWQGKDPRSVVFTVVEPVSPGYLGTMHMTLKEGRDFYAAPGADSNSVIINEAMAAKMGKEGKPGSVIINFDGRPLTVVGIIKDFVTNDMYKRPDPLLLYCRPSEASVLNIRFKAGTNIQAALNKVREIMKQYNPAYPFEYSFLDEDFSRQFKTETLIGKLAAVFSLLAIFISCLGLFGLAAYTAEQRTKEIGIRKVLGASVTGLMALLSREFVQLVGFSCLLAFPVTAWAMHNWLMEYAYRTSIHWWVFVCSGAGAVVIALATVSYQAIRAALANPVKTLRTT